MQSMSDTLLAAIVGAVAGIITGSIGSLFAPWANWGVEKRRLILEERRRKIGAWRRMLKEVAITRGSSGTLMELLERQENYLSLTSYLSEDTKSEVRRNTGTIPDSTIDHGLNILIDEVNRIEKEWKLV